MIRLAMKMAWLGILPCLAMAQGFKYFNATDTSAYPRFLSQTGLYLDIGKRRMIPGAVKFEVNSPLWSDGASKSRWILLKPGKSVTFREKDDYWDYPDSTVFIKQFAFDTLPGDSNSRILWETRLLINKKTVVDSQQTVHDFWYGLSYKWNSSQTDAELVSTYEGKRDKIRIYPHGLKKPSVIKKWVFPATWECIRCHFRHDPDRPHPEPNKIQGRGVLSFFTAQLNRPSPLTPGISQLEDFFRKGILKGERPGNWEAAPRWYAITDMSNPASRAGSLDGRVRAYLGSNCSGCHGARGILNSADHGVGMNFDFHTIEPQMFIEAHVPDWLGVDTLEPAAVPRGELVPGYPQKSFLLFRQLARNDDPDDYQSTFFQMPPLATFEVDAVATDSIRKWIREYKPAVSIQPPTVRLPLPAPAIRGRRVILPLDMLDNAYPRVTLHDLEGRKWELASVGNGAYAIPAALTRGVFILKVGGKVFLRNLF